MAFFHYQRYIHLFQGQIVSRKLSVYFARKYLAIFVFPNLKEVDKFYTQAMSLRRFFQVHNRGLLLLLILDFFISCLCYSDFSFQIVQFLFYDSFFRGSLFFIVVVICRKPGKEIANYQKLRVEQVKGRSQVQILKTA